MFTKIYANYNLTIFYVFVEKYLLIYKNVQSFKKLFEQKIFMIFAKIYMPIQKI